MEHSESRGSESLDLRGAVVRGGKIFAKNTGICVEDDYPGAKLHLGSGNLYWQGWVNIDLHSEKADLKSDLRSLDLPDGGAGVAVAIHVLEHFYQWEVEQVLLEWRRVLKPGGRLILEMPCMDKVFHYISKAVANKEPLMEWCSFHAFWGDPKYQSVAMTHKWGYTISSLKEVLESNGFEDVMFEVPRYHFPMRDMRAVATKGA